MRCWRTLALMLGLVFGGTTTAVADEPMSIDALLETFGWDLEATEITSEQVADGLHVIFGLGGNVAASIGEDGVLVVDDQFPQLVPKIEAEIRRLGGGKIDYAVNTHWHFDHADGNLALGPAGTTLVSHERARDDMARGGIINLVRARAKQPPYPPEALPTLTFDDRMRIHWNGEAIDLIHAGPAHTTGDVAVVFRGSNAVHFGDVFNNTGYPFIDVDNGGGIDGMIAFCEAVRKELRVDTVVIPGHGPVTDVETLDAYVEMLKTVRGRVAKLVAEGKTLEEVEAAGVAADYEKRYGELSESMGFVDRVFTSLSR